MNSNRKKRKNSKKDTDENGRRWERPKGYRKRYESGGAERGNAYGPASTSLSPSCMRSTSPSQPRTGARSPQVCLVDKGFRDNSYRGHASYLEANLGSLHACGLKDIPSKSCLHAATKRLAGRQDMLT